MRSYFTSGTNIDLERFRESPIGRLVPIRVEQGGQTLEHWAFEPEVLPEQIDLKPETFSAIESAAMAIGQLEGMASQLEAPYMITRPTIRREAVSTSALEGTFSTLEDLFAVGLGEAPPESQAVVEVANYVEAAETGVREIGTRPVSFNLICELHRILLDGTEHEHSSGELRRRQVAIGQRGALITEARFVPPPPGPGLEALFSDWEKWNYRQDALPLLARIAVSHYQFETIHPFIDGNGRIGRLIAILLLIDLGPLTDHYMVLSPYFEARRDRYVELLSATTVTGDFDPWVRLFVDAVHAEAVAARQRIASLLEYREETINRLRQAGLKGTIIEVAEQIIGNPVTTSTSMAKRFNVKYQTANRIIGRLVKDGILVEATGRSYGRIFVAREVLRRLRLGP